MALLGTKIFFLNLEGEGKRCCSICVYQALILWQVTYIAKSRTEGKLRPLLWKGGDLRIVDEWGQVSWQKWAG
jgi:hypothetical protein